MNKKALLIQAVTAAMTVGAGMNFHGQPPLRLMMIIPSVQAERGNLNIKNST